MSRIITLAEQNLFDLLDKARGPRGTGIPWIDLMTGAVKTKAQTPPPGANYLVDVALGRVKTKGRLPAPKPGSLAALVSGTKTKDLR